MATRLYQEKKTGKIVHAKPSASQPGIIVYYSDVRGKAGGRVLAATVEEFNDRFAIVTEGAAA